jgi:hypothetical protein
MATRARANVISAIRKPICLGTARLAAESDRRIDGHSELSNARAITDLVRRGCLVVRYQVHRKYDEGHKRNLTYHVTAEAFSGSFETRIRAIVAGISA